MKALQRGYRVLHRRRASLRLFVLASVTKSILRSQFSIPWAEPLALHLFALAAATPAFHLPLLPAGPDTGCVAGRVWPCPVPRWVSLSPLRGLAALPLGGWITPGGASDPYPRHNAQHLQGHVTASV